MGLLNQIFIAVDQWFHNLSESVPKVYIKINDLLSIDTHFGHLVNGMVKLLNANCIVESFVACCEDKSILFRCQLNPNSEPQMYLIIAFILQKCILTCFCFHHVDKCFTTLELIHEWLFWSKLETIFVRDQLEINIEMHRIFSRILYCLQKLGMETSNPITWLK